MRLLLTLLACTAALAQSPATDPAPRKLPFHTTVDELQPSAFIHQNKDGKKVTFRITEKTVIKQGETDARFTDIKLGDTVSGSRIKTKDDGTEYEVVKITKFGRKE